MSESENEAIVKKIDNAVAALSEFCDSVQIFATWHDGGNEITRNYDTGAGNFLTRFGQIVEWREIQRQYQRNHAIRKDGMGPRPQE